MYPPRREPESGSPLTHLSGNRIEGYSEEQLNGRRWRVYTLIVGDHNHLIQGADDYSVRVESVRNFALSAMKPMLIIFPLLLVWIGLSIVRAIVELHDATMVLANRQDHPGLSVTVIFPEK